jgi:putative ABC transport system permease protein
MKTVINLAIRYLLARKLRTALTTVAIVLGVMIIFGFNGLLLAMRESLQQGIPAVADQADVIITSELRSGFSTDWVKKVATAEGVAVASGLLVRTILLPDGLTLQSQTGAEVGALVICGVDPETIGKVGTLPLGQGRWLKPEDQEAVVIPAELARKNGLKTGDWLVLPSVSGIAKFKVAGTVSAGAAFGASAIYLPLVSAQKLLNQPGKINVIAAEFTPGGAPDRTRRAILGQLGPGFKFGGLEAGTEFAAAFQMGQFIYTVFGLLALAMGGLVIFNTFRMAVAERKRDLGMLRAVGATRRTILGVVLTESILQGLIGTLLGLGLGYLLLSGLLAWYGSVWENLSKLTLGLPHFGTADYLTAIALGIGAAVIGGLYPALLAARISPLAALRPERQDDSERSAEIRLLIGGLVIMVSAATLAMGKLRLSSCGILLFLVGLMLLGPALIQPVTAILGRLFSKFYPREGPIAQRNLNRHPGRSAITVSTLMIGLAILLALFSVSTSVFSVVVTFAGQSLGADYLLMPPSLILGGGNVGAAPDLVASIRNTPGIARVSTLRQTTAKIGNQNLQMIGIDPAVYPRLAALYFSAGDPGLAYAGLQRGRAIIINAILAAQNRYRIGQELNIRTPEGPRTYRIVGIGTDFLNAKIATGYISQANLAADFHETSDLLIMADRAQNSPPPKVRTDLQRIAQRYPAFKLYNTEEYRDLLRINLNGITALLYLMMTLITAPSLVALVNTLVLNGLEQTREIGMLRAVGATRSQIRRMVTAESLLLASAGGAFGIPAGLWLGHLSVAAMTLLGFPIRYHFPYAGILWMIAAGLLVGALGALIPARQAAKRKIVDALRYE